MFRVSCGGLVESVKLCSLRTLWQFQLENRPVEKDEDLRVGWPMLVLARMAGHGMDVFLPALSTRLSHASRTISHTALRCVYLDLGLHLSDDWNRLLVAVAECICHDSVRLDIRDREIDGGFGVLRDEDAPCVGETLLGHVEHLQSSQQVMQV